MLPCKIPRITLIGVFAALQGAFAEHKTHLASLAVERRIVILLVRTVEDLYRCDGLIIPGGGAPHPDPIPICGRRCRPLLTCQQNQQLSRCLRDYLDSWNLCGVLSTLNQYGEPALVRFYSRRLLKAPRKAGRNFSAALLSRLPEMAGVPRSVLWTLHIAACANTCHGQVESFEAALTVHGLRDSARPYPGVFIRAPVRVLSFPPQS
jgi:pyridoxal 5'-phosphate synthase pdxT subunit